MVLWDWDDNKTERFPITGVKSGSASSEKPLIKRTRDETHTYTVTDVNGNIITINMDEEFARCS